MHSEKPLIGVNLLYVRRGYMGGTVRYPCELLKRLASEGRFRYLIYIQEGVELPADPILDGIPRRRVRVRGGLFGRILIEHLALPLMAARNGVALLFSPGFVSPLWGRFRKVVTIHDLYYRLFPAFVRPWQRRYWTVSVPLSLRCADRVIAVSDTTKHDIAGAYTWSAGKLVRIHLGADAMVPAEQNATDRPYFLMVGNVTPNKNVEVVLEAMEKLRESGRDCRLVLAGKDIFGILREKSEKFSEVPDFEVVENLDDRALAGFYAGAIALIQASRYEGFGLPVVEAMHAGCPVIVGDIPVAREVAGNAALYFDPGSPEALSEAMLAVRDDELRIELKSRGWKNAARFTWVTAAQRTEALFRELVGG